uniref:Uncharacterized protein n=1 Tax=Sulfolobus neozealandicus TaxID=299422 RepID=Q5DVE5_9CREN|nr:hypothetical protein [Sulfolobus neozealandicus]
MLFLDRERTLLLISLLFKAIILSEVVMSMAPRKTSRIKKGISPIFGTIFFLLIFTAVLATALIFINNQANLYSKGFQLIQQEINMPIVFEYWHNGIEEFATTQPFVITHIILPNGEILNKTILVQGVIPVENLTMGYPWAIIVTSRGTWYNITPVYLPSIVYPDPNVLYSGIPWNVTALNVGLKPNYFAALKGVMLINRTPDTIYAKSNILYETGFTNETIIAYVANDSGTLIIYFYAPLHSVVNVENPYWKYYTLIPSNPLNPIDKAYYFGILQPFNYPYFYQLISTNPDLWLIPSLWYSAIYYKDAGQSIQYPGGGIYFNYSYVNATLGIYIPVNDSVGNIGYLYLPINAFEVTGLSAAVPENVSPPILSGISAKANNIQIINSQYSWIVVPLQSSPPTGRITNAYSVTDTFTLAGYYSNGNNLEPYEVQYIPPYTEFPSTGYGGFVSYFGNNYEYLESFLYSVNDPDYHGSQTVVKVHAPGAHGPIYMNVVQKGMFSFIYYQLYTQELSRVTYYAENGNPDVTYSIVFPTGLYAYANATSDVRMIPAYYDPIQLFALEINFPAGTIQLFGFDQNTGNWILLYESSLSLIGMNFEFVHALPIYVEAPYGTYVTAASFSNQTLTYL